MTAGELVIIAARPGVGKTWAIQAWIEKTLLSSPEAAAALLEMEMLPWQMGERLTAHALGLAPKDATMRARGDLTVDEVMHGNPALERLSIHPRSLTVGQLPEALDAATERLGRRPTILAVDYMGLLAWDGSPGASTYQRASDNARRLKDIAREENVIVLAASQLSRAAGTGSSRPGLDSIRDSGVIEEAADRILGMWRDQEIEDPDAAPTNGEVLLTVLKNRHGRSNGNDLPLRFDEAMRLVEPGMEEQEEFPF
jgi:replicative DNA helicase